jgi:ferritin-like metal-binding protein YciE
MNKIINLKDLLKHEILDLYSAEKQIIKNLPLLIEKANMPELRETLSKHLALAKLQKKRLDKIKANIMTAEEEADGDQDQGFFSNLFGGTKRVSSKGVAGLIKEAKKIVAENMTPQALDAAIIGSAQKIGHYKIAGYGTVHAYATELKLDFPATELNKTLHESYSIDDSLTKLAVGKVNPEAEKTVDDEKAAFEDDFNFLSNSVSIMRSSGSDDDD